MQKKRQWFKLGMEGRQREGSGGLNCSLSLLTYMSWEDKDHFRGRRGSSFKLIGQAAGQGTRTSQSQTDTEEEGVCISVWMCVCVQRCACIDVSVCVRLYLYAHICECVTGQSYFDPLSLYTCQSYCHNRVQSWGNKHPSSSTSVKRQRTYERVWGRGKKRNQNSVLHLEDSSKDQSVTTTGRWQKEKYEWAEKRNSNKYRCLHMGFNRLLFGFPSVCLDWFYVRLWILNCTQRDLAVPKGLGQVQTEINRLYSGSVRWVKLQCK